MQRLARPVVPLKEAEHDPGLFPLLQYEESFRRLLRRRSGRSCRGAESSQRVVESLTCERSLDDWRDWVLHVSDDRGDELFIVPFTFVLDKPH